MMLNDERTTMYYYNYIAPGTIQYSLRLYFVDMEYCLSSSYAIIVCMSYTHTDKYYYLIIRHIILVVLYYAYYQTLSSPSDRKDP